MGPPANAVWGITVSDCDEFHDSDSSNNPSTSSTDSEEFEEPEGLI